MPLTFTRKGKQWKLFGNSILMKVVVVSSQVTGLEIFLSNLVVQPNFHIKTPLETLFKALVFEGVILDGNLMCDSLEILSVQLSTNMEL